MFFIFTFANGVKQAISSSIYKHYFWKAWLIGWLQNYLSSLWNYLRHRQWREGKFRRTLVFTLMDVWSKAWRSVIVIVFLIKIHIESINLRLLKSDLTRYFWYIQNYWNWLRFVSFVKFWSTKLHKSVCFWAKNVNFKAKTYVWRLILLIFLLSFVKILWLQNFPEVLVVW